MMGFLSVDYSSGRMDCTLALIALKCNPSFYNGVHSVVHSSGRMDCTLALIALKCNPSFYDGGAFSGFL